MLTNTKVIFERLDQALSNNQWLQLYPTAMLQNLSILGSGLATITLNTGCRRTHGKYIQFEFKAKSLLCPKFFELVKNVWSSYHILKDLMITS